ncbi:CoxG family protein [Oryzifoliimicrobium ureilyticus]|uniref:CoxG family protein n=1 Tax=Oryzifoliimicrobium ureilyticus TaxID=3113724 RepID=UPI00307633C8
MDITGGEFDGEERINAPRLTVWACLNDPDLLRECIPGCRSLEWISDNELSAAIKISFGPLSATFKGVITLSNVVPGRSYTLSAEGKGGLAGFAKGACDVDLVDDGDDTLLRYRARAEVGGRIAKLGMRLVDSTSTALASRFFSDLNEAIMKRVSM